MKRTIASPVVMSDLAHKVIEKVQQIDTEYASLIAAGVLDPKRALTTLATLRDTWEALIPGIGEKLVGEKTEKAALRRQAEKEEAA